MALFRRNRGSTQTAIVAAAQPIGATGDKATQAFIKRREDWQTRAWEYYDEIGEVRQVARSMGDVFARVPWYVGVRPDPQGDVLPLLEADDADLFANAQADLPADLQYTAEEAATANTILADLASPIGGQSEIRRQIGVSLFVPGECYLVGTPETPGAKPGPPGMSIVPAQAETVCWDVRSTEELDIDYGSMRENSQGQRVPTYRLTRPGQSGRGKELPVDTFVVRIWRPHPRIQDWADSPMRSAMMICGELLTLTQAIEGAARSRTAGRGILVLPNSMRDGAGQRQQGDGQAARTDKVVSDIIEAASLAIDDPRSAASQVPLVVFVNDDVYDKVTSGNALIQWDRDVDRVAAEQRTELLTRFANAIDWPAELLTGKVGINHWGAWLLKDEAFQSNAEPYEIIACDAVTNWYLRPMLAAEGIDRPERFMVWYDPTGVVSDPDESDKAIIAADHFLISNARTRRAMGFTEDDAPSDEELLRSIQIQAYIRNPTTAPLPTLDGQTPPPAMPAPAVALPAALAPVVVLEPEPVIAAASRLGLDALPDILGEIDRALLTETHERADATMRRALERANARLKTLAQRQDRQGVYTTIQSIGAHTLGIGPALGQAIIDKLTAGTEPGQDLFAGEFASFLAWFEDRMNRAAARLLDLMDEYGSPQPVTADGAMTDQERAQAESELRDAIERAAALLAASLASLASALLLRPEPLGPPGEGAGSLVPAGTIRSALVTAGGEGHGAAGWTSGSIVRGQWGRVGVEFHGYRWVYGDPSSRQRNYPPHLALNGQVFGDTDADALGSKTDQAGYGWPGVSHYWPGDHPGCLCRVELVNPARTQVAALESQSGRWSTPVKSGHNLDATFATYDYRGGHVQVLVDRAAGITAAQRDEFLKAVAELSERVARGPHTITISDALVEAAHPGALGVTIGTEGYKQIILKTAVLQNAAIGDVGQFMPAAATTSPMRYILAHEWGHVVSPADPGAIKMIAGGSTYAGKTQGEAVAEAFAEWFLTNGTTTDPFAQGVAETLGWSDLVRGP